MLALTNISLRRGRKVLFENASFQIHAGQRMGVIGANGSGKSSLFAMVLGEVGRAGGLLPSPKVTYAATKSPQNFLLRYLASPSRNSIALLISRRGGLSWPMSRTTTSWMWGTPASRYLR